MIDARTPIIIALDFPTAKQALALADQLDPARYAVKIGSVLFTRHGNILVERLVAKGFRVFLDLKFHDIPNTVAHACMVAADLGVWMLNVHALGGRRMLEAAAQAMQTYGKQRPLLIAVTMLTSLDQPDIEEIGLDGSAHDHVLHLASMAQQSGCDGAVCSGQEAQALRKRCNPSFCLVTPGIRLPDNTIDDQVRTMTPYQALKAGANYLVVGRPMTAAVDPLQALDRLEQDIQKAY
jgi:orotidine-5'-phosphate decarboxylase